MVASGTGDDRKLRGRHGAAVGSQRDGMKIEAEILRKKPWIEEGKRAVSWAGRVDTTKLGQWPPGWGIKVKKVRREISRGSYVREMYWIVYFLMLRY